MSTFPTKGASLMAIRTEALNNKYPDNMAHASQEAAILDFALTGDVDFGVTALNIGTGIGIREL